MKLKLSWKNSIFKRMIITFLAILEMMKMGVIKIVQETIFSEIVIKFVGREHHDHGDS